MRDDVRWMRRAIDHARRGLGRTTPNPVVGAVRRRRTKASWSGRARTSAPASRTRKCTRSTKRATPPAARRCTARSSRASHTGRTGPCTDRIIAAGIRRVVAAMEDPFPLVQRQGIRRAAGAWHRGGRGALRRRGGAPQSAVLTTVRARTAVCDCQGRDEPRWSHRRCARARARSLTSAAALRHAQYQRASVDAIARRLRDGARGRSAP